MAREAFDNPPVNNSSGRAHMSLTSWGRLLREVLRVEAGTSTVAPADVARQTTSAAVTVNATTSYGMGWHISTRSWANGKVLYHDGSNGANHFPRHDRPDAQRGVPRHDERLRSGWAVDRRP